jgi:hypothetical protein
MDIKERGRIMSLRVNKPQPLHRLINKTKRNDNTRSVIIPMTKAMAKTLPELDGVKMPYGKSGSFMIDDPGVAQALQDKYGKKHLDIWQLDKNIQWHPADKGHRYEFGGVALPWHKYCELCGRKLRNDEINICRSCEKDYEVQNMT